MAFIARVMLCAAVVVLCVSFAAAQADRNHFGRPIRIKNGCGFRGLKIELPFYPLPGNSVAPTTAEVRTKPQGTNVMRSFFVGTPQARYGSSTANVVIMDDNEGGNLRVASGMVNTKFEALEYGGKIYNGRVSFNGNLYFNYPLTGAASVTSELVVVGGTGDFLGATGSMTTGIVGGLGGFKLDLQIPVKNCFN